MNDDRPFQIYRRLLSYLRGSSGRIALILVALLVHAVAMLLVPWLIQSFFRDAALEENWAVVYPALGFILVLFLVIHAARFAADDQLELVSLRMTEHLRNEVVGKLVQLPIRSFVRNRAGDSVSRAFNDVNVLKNFLGYACFTVGSDLLRVVGAIGMLFLLSWPLALGTLVLGLLGAGTVTLSSRWVRRRFHRVQRALADMTSLLTEQAGALPTIQAYGAAQYEQERFGARARCHAHEALWGNRYHGISQALVNVFVACATVLVLAIGAAEALAAAQVGAGGVALERLVGFGLYTALIASPLGRLGRTNLEIQQSLAAARHLFELLDEPPEQASGSRPLGKRPVGVLHLEGVSFRYRPDEPILIDIDMTIRPGEPVAVVGPSGAGKSSLTYLLLRFYEPDAGRILLDTHELQDLSLSDLRRHIGWVGQEPFILSGTVAENIRYGCWKASPQQVLEAARLAQAHEFIRALPDGYETHLGERGLNLSGGQRARLALARAILRDPAIIILDEATAALDTETETRLWLGLKDWLAKRTTLVIAHRLITVLGCQRIIVLEDGCKVGDGSAEELARTCPAFNRLFLEQMRLTPRAA